MRHTFPLFVALAWPVFAWAGTTLSEGTDAGHQRILTLRFEDKDAKALYQQLDYARTHEGYVVQSGTAGAIYLSSPTLTCKRSSPSASGRRAEDDSPALYHCDATLGANGLVQSR